MAPREESFYRRLINAVPAPPEEARNALHQLRTDADNEWDQEILSNFNLSEASPSRDRQILLRMLRELGEVQPGSDLIDLPDGFESLFYSEDEDYRDDDDDDVDDENDNGDGDDVEDYGDYYMNSRNNQSVDLMDTSADSHDSSGSSRSRSNSRPSSLSSSSSSSLWHQFMLAAASMLAPSGADTGEQNHNDTDVDDSSPQSSLTTSPTEGPSHEGNSLLAQIFLNRQPPEVQSSTSLLPHPNRRPSHRTNSSLRGVSSTHLARQWNDRQTSLGEYYRNNGDNGRRSGDGSRLRSLVSLDEIIDCRTSTGSRAGQRKDNDGGLGQYLLANSPLASDEDVLDLSNKAAAYAGGDSIPWELNGADRSINNNNNSNDNSNNHYNNNNNNNTGSIAHKSTTALAPCSWLASGIVFTGTQHMSKHKQSSTSSSTLLRNSANRAMEQQPSPSSSSLWFSGHKSKICLLEVDYETCRISGSIVSYDIPGMSKASSGQGYFNGEIIDFNQYQLRTGKWNATATTDLKHWCQFEPFKGLSKTSVKRKLMSDKFLHYLTSNYIFMRWKESDLSEFSSSAASPSPILPPITTSNVYHRSESSGFGIGNRTIGGGDRSVYDRSYAEVVALSSGDQATLKGGFYYACLRRKDGYLESIFFQPLASHAQHMELYPEGSRMQAMSFAFR